MKSYNELMAICINGEKTKRKHDIIFLQPASHAKICKNLTKMFTKILKAALMTHESNNGTFIELLPAKSPLQIVVFYMCFTTYVSLCFTEPGTPRNQAGSLLYRKLASNF